MTFRPSEAEVQPLLLMNSSTMTADGLFFREPIADEEAKELVAAAHANDRLVSALGHRGAAEALSLITGVEVTAPRTRVEQQIGQLAVVLQVDTRLPEGKVLTRKELDEVGYSLKKVTRLDPALLPDNPV